MAEDNNGIPQPKGIENHAELLRRSDKPRVEAIRRHLEAHPGLESCNWTKGGVTMVGSDGGPLAVAVLVSLAVPGRDGQTACFNGDVADRECHDLRAAQGGAETDQQHGAMVASPRRAV